MMLTSKMILDIMEQIEKEERLVYNDWDDTITLYQKESLEYKNRWRVLKHRIKNLGVLRNSYE